MKDLILVDASWVIHRMWHVHRDLKVTLHSGSILQSGHLYGVARLLKSLTTKYPEADIIVCLDGVAEHGKALSSDYKANRDAGSVHTAFDDLGVLVECSLAFKGVTVAFHRSLEADEVISYFVHSKKAHYDRVIIYSADGDMLQLLAAGDNIFIAKEFNRDGMLSLVDSNVYGTNEHYLDKFVGTDLEVLPLYRAIVGDSSDNLAGFPRIRRKVAKEIAEKYRTTERVAGGCLAGDPLFPEGFKSFLGSLNVNYEIMKLPTPYDLEQRGTVPHVYDKTDNPGVAQTLYSLYRIRSTSPVETLSLDEGGEQSALFIREAINDNWRHPNSSNKRN